MQNIRKLIFRDDLKPYVDGVARIGAMEYAIRPAYRQKKDLQRGQEIQLGHLVISILNNEKVPTIQEAVRANNWNKMFPLPPEKFIDTVQFYHPGMDPKDILLYQDAMFSLLPKSNQEVQQFLTNLFTKNNSDQAPEGYSLLRFKYVRDFNISRDN